MGQPDTIDPRATIRRIGFGSCNNQNKGPQEPLWAHLQKQQFDLWVWSGDVVYPKGGTLDALSLAYDQLRRNGSYFEFARSVGRVVGTWDDHDLGVNDGGARTPNLEERKHLFLDFLGVPKDSPRRKRRGVYSSHEFGDGMESVRVILMDTRSGRSDYALAQIGSIGEGTLLGKLFPKLAAASRSFFGLTGLTEILSDRGISNDRVLSEEQWQWLEQQLRASTASINILVSSVQVLTRNPSVESWGHFPGERRRLLRLILDTKPKGFVLISGDVHIAIASSPAQNLPVLELTSSGLTHTCTAGGVPKELCSAVWNWFELPDRRQNMILSRNYGDISIDWTKRHMKCSLNSLTEENSLHFDRSFESYPEFSVDDVAGITPEYSRTLLLASVSSIMVVFALMIRMILSRRQRFG